MKHAPQTYTARWIFPVDAPPLEGGTITVDGGTIVAVEPRGVRWPDADLGNVALVPGFVNAHTHLDLTGARGLCPPSPDFTQWLRSVIAFRRARSPEQVQADIAAGVAECVRHGTTLLGDISAGGASLDTLKAAPCRALAFFELLGLSEERGESAWAGFEAWSNALPPDLPDGLRIGLSPHAPYSVGVPLFRRAAASCLPIATHLGETRAELELLASRSGPFAEFLKELNVWHPPGLVADLFDVVKLFPRGLFVHGNYLDAATPFSPSQSLVVCPRTHAAFGHPRHPFPKMSVRIALGTDSLASNPDLDILAEARFVRRHHPEVEPAAILRMLTLNGAAALGFEAVTGSLTPGKSADLVVVPLANDERADPHDLILDSALPIGRVMFRGVWMPPVLS